MDRLEQIHQAFEALSPSGRRGVFSFMVGLLLAATVDRGFDPEAAGQSVLDALQAEIEAEGNHRYVTT